MFIGYLTDAMKLLLKTRCEISKKLSVGGKIPHPESSGKSLDTNCKVKL